MKEEMQGFHMTPIAEYFWVKKALLNHLSPSKFESPRKKDAGTAIWPKNSRLVASWGFRMVLYYLHRPIFCEAPIFF